MPADSDFVDYVLDCMAGAGPVRPVRFFGGTGLTLDGVQFAYVTGSNRLFFVVDDVTRPRYQAVGMEPFSYTRRSGKRVVERWYELPEDVLMDGDELRQWMRDAVAIAARGKTSNKKPKPAAKPKTPSKSKASKSKAGSQSESAKRKATPAVKRKPPREAAVGSQRKRLPRPTA